MRRPSTILRIASAALLCVAPSVAAQQAAAEFDLIVRGGTIVDGSGAGRYRGDVGIVRGHIARIGDLSAAKGRSELDARGLFVAPGFINIHSHPDPDVLPTAVNMLTQGVTLEIFNADGSGAVDIDTQLEPAARRGLAVNVGASAGFNTAWRTVVGLSDRRPSPDELAKVGSIVTANLEKGAFGVSAGLDYKPAYFATTEEVIKALEPVRKWRTFFPNHDRLRPEWNYSSKRAMEETMAIGQATGMVPVFTHMKAQGRARGTGGDIAAMMTKATANGTWVAGDVYPYLAGQTALAALIIPGWAQDGGVEKMRERFKDPALRAKIIAEANEGIAARLTGPEGIMLNESGRRISDIMKERGLATPGEAVVAVLETEYPSMIATFGAEEDLVRFLRHPDVVVACDCGAWTATRAHPRGFGTFPRVLGRYVREQKIMGWEEAVRKMTGLPAALIGLADRGMIAPGMAADITVFDTAAVIDHATYEKPDAVSEGIRHVVVNGVVALRDGAATGEKGGAALRRSPNVPSRPMAMSARRATAEGRWTEGAVERMLAVSLEQGKGARAATGRVRVSGDGFSLESVSLGVLQVAPRWWAVTGRARVTSAGSAADGERAFTLVLDVSDPTAGVGVTTAVLHVEGMPAMRGTLHGKASVTP